MLTVHHARHVAAVAEVSGPVAAMNGAGVRGAASEQGFVWQRVVPTDWENRQMKALTSKTIRMLERQLQAQRATMLDSARAELLRGEQESYATIAGEVPDVGDQATAALLTDFDNEIARRHGEAMRHIDDALLRIKKPDFGVCIDCGDDIAVERLTVFPTANRCVTCQGMREKTYAHMAIPTL